METMFSSRKTNRNGKTDTEKDRNTETTMFCSLQLPRLCKVHRQSNIVTLDEFVQRTQHSTTFQARLHQNFAGRHKRFSRTTPGPAWVDVLRQFSRVKHPVALESVSLKEFSIFLIPVMVLQGDHTNRIRFGTCHEIRVYLGCQLPFCTVPFQDYIHIR